jgi:hypothetical protein
MIWAGRRQFFNQSSDAAIRFYSATKADHIAFSGVSTSIRLPLAVAFLLSLYPVFLKVKLLLPFSRKFLYIAILQNIKTAEIGNQQNGSEFSK